MPVPWVPLIKAAPVLMAAAAQLVSIMKGEPRSGSTKDLTDVQDRLNAMESNAEAQAELIAQLAEHHAALVRWLLLSTLVLVAVGGTAVAGLVIALL